jgi:tetratricopeptide (TPR) repeat protein
MHPRAVLSLVFLGVGLAFPLSVSATETADPPPPSAAVDSARAKVAAGDQAGAMRDLAAYVPQHVDDLAAARLLGDLYFRIPDYKRAEATWRAILAHLPDDGATHNRLGSLYAAEDRIDDAVGEFEKSLPSPSGFAGLVAEHRRRGDLAAFEESYAERIELHQQDVTALWYYGSILHELHEFTQAQSYLDRAAALRPSSCPLMIDAGNNSLDLARYDVAVATFNRCLSQEPKNYVALVDLGEAYKDQNQFDRAREYYERALRVRPDGPEALVDVGYLEDAAGDWKSAVSKYIAAMSADPLQAAAYIDLGFDYSEHRFYALAEAALIKGLTVEPRNGRLHYLLAVTYNVQGKVELAREQYRRAIDAKDDAAVARAAQSELALLPP